MPSKQDAVDDYHEQGFVVVDDAVEAEMVDELEAAARRIKEKIRSGEVDVCSSVDEDGEPKYIWGLIAPEYGEPVFAEYLICEPLEAYTHAFLGSELRLGFATIFGTGTGKPYDSTWHRDLAQKDIGATEEEEMALLNAAHYGLKWHLALVDDPCFFVVPGSHRRYRTEEEAEVLSQRRRDDLSTAVQVELKRRQTLFWSGKTIHRGVAVEGVFERMALHCGMVQYRPDEPMEDETDGRFAWQLSPHIRDALPEKLQLYWDRWRVLQPEPAQ